jgi:cytochrome c556
MKKTMKLIALALVLTLSVVMLASCFGPNADPEKAIASLEENGYKAAKDKTVLPIVFTGLGIKDVDAVVSGTAIIDDKAEHVTIVYFETAEAAKAAWEDMKEYAEKEDKDEEDTDWTVAKFGKMIYWGTKAAIKATY